MILPPLRLVPQAGPATWQGADLTPADWMLPIGAEEADELEAGLAGPETAALPRLDPLLSQVAARLETGRGFVLLRGLPLGRFDGPGRVEAMLRLIGARLGTVLPQDAAGSTVLGQTGGGGPVLGAPMRFQADPADAVALLCLRQEPTGGDVTLLSAPALHNALLKRDRTALAVLHRGLPQRPHAEAEPLPVPVFSTAGGVFVSRCDHGAILESAMTGEERAALTALETAATTPGLALTIPLHPGDLLFRNPLLVWKRAGAEEAAGVPDAARRALLRLWLSTPGARALPESYRAVFGAVEAGAHRGGIAGQRGMVGG